MIVFFFFFIILSHNRFSTQMLACKYMHMLLLWHGFSQVTLHFGVYFTSTEYGYRKIYTFTLINMQDYIRL